MAKKQVAINPSQGALFTMHSHDSLSHLGILAGENFPSEQHKEVHGAKDRSVVYGPEGSYVDLSTRAAYLQVALAAFGLRNQRLGFDVASNTRHLESPIWKRYTRNTPKVQKGAARNAEAYLDKAKQNFWHATGYAALRSSGIVPKHEADANAAKIWRDFSAMYADPDKTSRRDAYSRQLKRSAKRLKAIRER